MYENLRDNFLYGLSDYYYTGKMPPRASLNMRRALDEHRKRLAKKGVTYSEIIKPSEEPREMSKKSGIEFIRADIVGDYLHVLATLYLDNTYYRDGRFIRKNENFQIELIRNRSVKTNPLITAYSINCPHCGASFDSVLSKTCPSCGSGFELAGHDWTIVRLYCVS